MGLSEAHSLRMAGQQGTAMDIVRHLELLRSTFPRDFEVFPLVGPLMPDFLESGWLPMGTDGCGSYYIFPLNGDFGPGLAVVLHDHEYVYNPAYIMALDQEDFIRFLVEDKVTSAASALDGGSYRWPFE